MKLKCKLPPVINVKQGKHMYHVGATVEIDIDDINGFWQGQIDRGSVEIIPEITSEIIKPNKANLPAPNLTKNRARPTKQGVNK